MLFHCFTTDQSPMAREQVHIAREFSATEDMKDGLAVTTVANQLDAATEYEEDAMM